MLQQAHAELAAATAGLTIAEADLIRKKAVLVHNEMEWVTAVAHMPARTEHEQPHGDDTESGQEDQWKALSEPEITAYLSDTSKCCILQYSQGNIPGFNGSNACTTISVLACQAFINNQLNITLPCSSEVRTFLEELMKTGNERYPHSDNQDAFDALIVNEVPIPIPDNILLSVCYEEKAWQGSTRLSKVLRSFAEESERTAAILTARGKTISLMGGHNDSFAIFDSHSYEKYVQPGGAAWITGTVEDAEKVAAIIMYILTADDGDRYPTNVHKNCFATMYSVQKQEA